MAPPIIGAIVTGGLAGVSPPNIPCECMNSEGVLVTVWNLLPVMDIVKSILLLPVAHLTDDRVSKDGAGIATDWGALGV